MSSFSRTERAKPLLGTVVRIRVCGLDGENARAAFDAAFAEIAAIHTLMSFHEDKSDVARLNHEAHCWPIEVDWRTYEVLTHACAISAATEGTFDISVASTLVARGLLPPSQTACEPDETATWRDIELLRDFQIRFRKPLWIDLGGIAKGYAVDRAIEILRGFRPEQAVVNAGGDLRVTGAKTERIRLGSDMFDAEIVPVMEIRDGSLASSCGAIGGRGSGKSGPHIDPSRANSRRPMQFISVAAPRCMDADALTKVVMARGACAAKALAKFNAQAVVHDAQFGWRQIRGHA